MRCRLALSLAVVIAPIGREMRAIGAIIFAALVVMSSSPALAAWNTVIDDNFSHADTSTGGAGTTTGVPTQGGWTDVHGGVWQIITDQAKGTSDGSTNSWARDFLLSPATSDTLDERIVGTTGGGNSTGSTGTNFWMSLRYNPNSGNATQYACRMDWQNNDFTVYALTGQTIDATVLTGAISPAPNASDTYTFDCSAVGSGPTTISVTVTDTTTSTVVGSGSATDSTAALQSAGQVGLIAGTGSPNTPVDLWSHVTTYDDVTMSVSPTFVIQSSTGNSLTLTGSGTSWSPGTPGSPTFTTSCGTITAQTVASATSATLTYTAPASGSSCTITDPSQGDTASFAIKTFVAVNDPNVFFSPYNWDVTGSTDALTNAQGYIKIGFTGTSQTLDVSVASLVSGSVASGQYPGLRWIVDDGPATTQQLTSSSSAISIASGLSAGTHQAQINVVYQSSSYDRWNTPVVNVDVTGFILDSGATGAAPTLYAKRCIIYGDSITEGVDSTGGTSNPTQYDAELTWASFAAYGLGCEYGQIGFGGQGWTITGAGNVVPFFTPSNDAQSAWDKYYSGASRLSGGLLSPAPDYVIENHGYNDHAVSSTTVASAVEGWLSAVRTAAPSAKIFVVIPYAGASRTGVTNGFNAYEAMPDPNAKLIDTGTDGWFGTVGSPSQTFCSTDGIHPNYLCAGRLAAMVDRAVTPVQQIGIIGGN